MNKQINAAEVLVRYSTLNTHPALSSSEIGIGQIDWAKISTTEMSRQEAILIEILRLVLIGQSSAHLSDLLLLNDLDLHAALLALNVRYADQSND
jgi:hypothetical protein